MHCYKVNSRLLSRFVPLIKRSENRNLSIPAASLSESNVQPQHNQNVPVVNENEIKIEYPPILDLGRGAKNRRLREEWHDKVKKLGTVEEKIFELNMPRYYGWRATKILEDQLPYDPLPQAQYYTRTHIEDLEKLPSFYDNILSTETLDNLTQQIKSQIEDLLVFEYFCRKQDYQYEPHELEKKAFSKNLKAQAMGEHVNRILINNLSPNYTHLLEAQMDIKPRIEAFWFFGGLEAPIEVVKSRSGRNWTKEFKDERVNQCIKYNGEPILHLRHNLPLKEIISFKDLEDFSFEVPEESLDPRKVGYFQERMSATVIPGFWPGDPNEFGIVSYINTGHLAERPEGYNDHLDAAQAKAIFSSFSWLYGQACYQGFSTFQDPTYPLVNQTIITNGQWWSFCVYQLNTTTMHIDCFNENLKSNICWFTKPMKLFTSVEDGKVQNLNEDVLKNLIKFYANVPEVREGIEMKPYLSREAVIAGVEEPERRVWLEEKYKHLMSNRPRHLLAPEIYHWQKIYMINNKTRPLDTKREPWQFGINPYYRRLDDHTPEYIPKILREYPKSKKKWAKTYYPEVRNIENNK